MKVKSGLIFFLTLNLTKCFAQDDVPRSDQYNTKANIAIEGYDPVSYFSGEPQLGNADFKLSFKGIIYCFVSSENLGKFKANPVKFEPAYGGWCAYAMGATGEKVKIDPETFKIIDGKLYLFYNFWGNNTREDWDKNERRLKERADQNWVAIFK
jgi:YHS domain-containing protein